MPALAGWLAATPLARAMRDQPWLYPLVEIVHIAGFAVLVGAVALFDLRVLGCGRRGGVPVRALGRFLLPWSLASLALVVPAGLLMFAAQPVQLLANQVFLLKLTLIAVAGLNALVFHLTVYRPAAAATWAGADSGCGAPWQARAQALLSILLWLAVISCGRLLAYV